MATINGTALADVLKGTGGGVVDTINGGLGDDVIYSVNAPLTDTAAWAADAAAPGAGDVLNGGDGNDTIVGSAGAVIDGGTGNDVLDGLAGSRITGGAGNDTIGGATAVYTGNRADYAVLPTLTYIGNGQWASVYEVTDLRPGSPDGMDIVYADAIQFADGLYTPPGASDSDALFLSTSHEEVFTLETGADVAVPGSPTLVLDANNLLAFGVTAASFAIAGGADAAAFTIDPVTGELSFATPPDFEAPTDAAAITQGAGIQPSVAADNVYEVVLRVVDANGAEDLVGVLVHVDDLFGEFAAAADGDVLIGSLENDLMDDGGFANVSMLGFDGNDSFTTHGPATVDGGLDVDTIELVRDATSNLTLTETAGNGTLSDGSQLRNLEALTFTGSTSADVFNGSGATSMTLELNGNEGNDQLTGGAANDTLIGGAGSDLLLGGGGNDTLYASLVPSPGAPNDPVPGEVDTLVGGAGHDVLVGDGANTVVLFAGNRANYTLTVDPLTGAVTVRDNVGTEGTDTVSDFGKLQFANQALDANLNPVGAANLAPVITSNGGGATAAITINENTSAVTTVTATDANGDPVRYAITGGADAALFQIDANTGALSFKAAPNAEAPADAGANGVYDLVVQATDGTAVDIQAMAVTVADVNEFAVSVPVDADAGVNHVATGAAAGTLVGVTARASDADATNNTVSYAITTLNSPFTINASTGVVSVAAGAVLNAATAASHTITVQARSSDGSVASQSFTIAVDPVGGNRAPVIDSNGAGATAAITVNENSAAVTTVHATDPDGNPVSYSISGGADAALFQINASTGALSFKAAPNAEAPADAGANGVYDVTVQASDGTLVDTQAIAVTVADVNEFAVSVPNDGNTSPISWLGGVRTSPAADGTTAADLQGGTSGQYGLLTGLGETGGAMTVAATVRFDTTGAWQRVVDFGQANSTGIGNVYVGRLGTTNDLTFTIEKNGVYTYRATAVGAITNGSWLSFAATVDATGLMKLYVNGTLAATTQGVAPDTGLRDAFYIGKSAFAADAAFDGAVDSLTLLRGSITDAQAKALYANPDPAATPGLPTGARFDLAASVESGLHHVASGAAAGASAGLTVQATDADATKNAVTYAITTAGSPFVINATTGVVTVAPGASINYALTKSYTIAVKATSADGSTASQNFNIVVDKPANVAPVIDSNGAGATAAVTVNENTTAVTTVHAADANGDALQYWIVGGADAAKFQISTAGVLSFKAAPNAEARTDADGNGVYDVVVQASDGLVADTQAIAVTVADVNEFVISATTDVDAAVNHVAVGSAMGTAVGITAKAIDADASRNTVSYAIAGFTANSAFKIDAATGVVSVNNPAAISYVVAQSHTITVTATSADGSVSSQAFTIAVDKPPATAPVIDSNGAGATAAISVNENTTLVTTVHATDINGDVVRYSISGGADAALFQINATTGVLSFRAAPNAEAPTDAGANGVYDLVVQASDGVLVDTQALAVKLVDVNEFAVGVAVDTDKAANTLAENLPAGSKVGITAKAVDADVSNNTVSYSLSTNPSNLFAIDAVTGVVTTAAALDYEVCALHTLVVKATSSDGSVSYATYTVNVTNANDAPVITSAGGGAAGSVSVAENTPLVTKVTATDQDLGQTRSYSITGGVDAAAFTINASTGELSFKGNGADFEKPADAGANNTYDVQVTVTDNLGASDTQALAVKVTDVAGLTLTGTNALINTLKGGGDGDVLTATGISDYLYGNAGDDLLVAGKGGYWLDGGVGQDTVSYANATSGVKADAGSVLGIGNSGGALGDVYTSIENLTGSAFSDTLIGSTGFNVLDGGAGNDMLVGKGGGDVLTGGAGKDIFDFNAVADSTPGSMTKIIDFLVGGDTIDLSGIDAMTTKAGDQAFNFVGTAAFSGKAGELRFEAVAGHTYVYADTNGDKVADFALDLLGDQKLVAASFVM